MRIEHATTVELADLVSRLERAVGAWSAQHAISGSVAGRYSFYSAVREAVEIEYERALTARRNEIGRRNFRRVDC